MMVSLFFTSTVHVPEKTYVLTSQMALTLPEFMTSALFRKRRKSIQNFNRHTMQVSVERERERNCWAWVHVSSWRVDDITWQSSSYIIWVQCFIMFHHHVPTTSAILVLSTIFGQTNIIRIHKTRTLSTLLFHPEKGSWVAKRMHIRATWILRGSLTRPRNAGMLN